MAMRPPRSVIAALLCQSPLTNVILSFSEESRYPCTPLSTGGREESEGVTHNMSLRGVPTSRDDAAISALLCQAPLTNVILGLDEAS